MYSNLQKKKLMLLYLYVILSNYVLGRAVSVSCHGNVKEEEEWEEGWKKRPEKEDEDDDRSRLHDRVRVNVSQESTKIIAIYSRCGLSPWKQRDQTDVDLGLLLSG